MCVYKKAGKAYIELKLSKIRLGSFSIVIISLKAGVNKCEEVGYFLTCMMTILPLRFALAVIAPFSKFMSLPISTCVISLRFVKIIKKKLTHELTQLASPSYSIITVVNYNLYQKTNTQINKRLTTDNNIISNTSYIKVSLSIGEREILKKYLLKQKRKNPIEFTIKITIYHFFTQLLS